LIWQGLSWLSRMPELLRLLFLVGWMQVSPSNYFRSTGQQVLPWQGPWRYVGTWELLEYGKLVNSCVL
jgi:hypothetical protein